MTVKSIIVTLLLALAGCTSTPRSTGPAPACSVSEASMACQVERYNNVSGD